MTIIDLTKGDATDAFGNIAFNININTTVDLTGCTARFQVGTIKKDFADITSKVCTVILSSTETDTLPEGLTYGGFKLFDSDEKPLTIVRDIGFRVASKVVDNDI